MGVLIFEAVGRDDRMEPSLRVLGQVATDALSDDAAVAATGQRDLDVPVRGVGSAIVVEDRGDGSVDVVNALFACELQQSWLLLLTRCGEDFRHRVGDGRDLDRRVKNGEVGVPQGVSIHRFLVVEDTRQGYECVIVVVEEKSGSGQVRPTHRLQHRLAGAGIDRQVERGSSGTNDAHEVPFASPSGGSGRWW